MEFAHKPVQQPVCAAPGGVVIEPLAGRVLSESACCALWKGVWRSFAKVVKLDSIGPRPHRQAVQNIQRGWEQGTCLAQQARSQMHFEERRGGGAGLGSDQLKTP